MHSSADASSGSSSRIVRIARRRPLTASGSDGVMVPLGSTVTSNVRNITAV